MASPSDPPASPSDPAASPSDLEELVGRAADAHLLDADPSLLPATVGRPEELPAAPGGRAIVATGVTLTGVTLLGGIALIAVALITSFSSGADLFRGALFALGIALVATHWGWVHVAELTATRLQAHGLQDVAARRRHWLEGVAPYTREEVVTDVEDDGSIAIVTYRYVPVASRPGHFTFTRLEAAREVHSPDEPAASVTDRAEQLRGQAAERTERERERFLAAADRYETARLQAEDARELTSARAAASRALSEQINANLREPPLT